MPPYVDEVLFNEPQGPPIALVQFGASLAFLGLFAYAWSRGGAGAAGWLLFLVVGTTLSGIAESLPGNRRRAAGVLRLGAILVLLTLVAAPFVGFESVFGV